MKPLAKKDITSFVRRFCNFVDAEIRDIKVLSASTIKITIACQDRARDFDWLTLNLEFTNIKDAKLVDDSKLSYIDMSEGLSLIHEENSFAFCIGKYNKLSSIKNAISYIISSNIKYEEAPF